MNRVANPAAVRSIVICMSESETVQMNQVPLTAASSMMTRVTGKTERNPLICLLSASITSPYDVWNSTVTMSILLCSMMVKHAIQRVRGWADRRGNPPVGVFSRL